MTTTKTTKQGGTYKSQTEKKQFQSLTIAHFFLYVFRTGSFSFDMHMIFTLYFSIRFFWRFCCCLKCTNIDKAYDDAQKHEHTHSFFVLFQSHSTYHSNFAIATDGWMHVQFKHTHIHVHFVSLFKIKRMPKYKNKQTTINKMWDTHTYTHIRLDRVRHAWKRDFRSNDSNRSGWFMYHTATKTHT